MKFWRWLSVILLACVLTGCGRSEKEAGDAGTPPAEESSKAATPSGMALAECPLGADLYLKFSADFTVREGDFKMTHLLEDGVLSLQVDRAGQIRALEPPQIPYTITGSADGCTISGQGSMTPNASGDCQGGVVRLIIVEDWAQGQATLTCGDRVSAVPLPSPGSMTHSGADGRGEIFYLDRNFTEEGTGAGYTSIRPFLSGEGEHVWTLYMPEIPTLPLEK